MSHHRSRGNSPPRYYVDQPRTTTSGAYTTSYDTSSKGGSSQQPRGSNSTVSSGGRSSVQYSAQPMRKSIIADGKTKTEYVVRPRQDSYDSQTKRPLSISTRDNLQSHRGSLVLASPSKGTSTAPRDDPNRFLQPAASYGGHSSHHQRHNSTSNADLGPRDPYRERRDKSYNPRAPYVERSHHEKRPPARAPDDEGWSYTGPREQFHRDYPQQVPRESESRRERPVRDYEIDRPAIRQDHVPPPAADKPPYRAGSNRLDTRSGFDSDPDRRSDVPKRRHSTRQPVLHQQAPNDDGYSSARDEYESRAQPRPHDNRYDDEPKPRERQREVARESERDRDYDRKYHRESERERPRDYNRDHGRGHDRDDDRDYDRNKDRGHDRDYNRDYDRDYDREDRPKDSRRKPRSRENSPDHSKFKEIAAGALSAFAGAGVIKGLGREHKDKDVEPDDNDDIDPRERRSSKQRRRPRQDDQYEGSDRNDDRRQEDRVRSKRRDDPRGETADQPPRRSRSHRRQRDEDESANEKGPDRQEAKASSKAHSRNDDEPHPDVDRPSQALVPISKEDDDLEYMEARTMSPGENEDDRPRRVQLVEPIKDRAESRPRSILKPARQVPFPEDPNPIREGVAPLKDATKDGIPPNARWTKINRMLVNPEALEKAQERFEERDEYVIVLRVLTREEIKKLADKTKEIREKREREWQEEEEQRRRNGDDGTRPTDSDRELDHNHDHDTDTEPRRQLAIEEGPSDPPADLQNLQDSQPQHQPGRGTVGGPPIPEVSVQGSYSQNV